MAEAIKTRIQLKNDTEANWKKSVLTIDNPAGEKVSGTSFIPKQGEIIIFSADNSHPFSRLKVGDGTTNVLSLPFIDSETVGGIYFCEGVTMLPGVGKENISYVDILSDSIYHWENNQYVLKYGLIKQSLSDFFDFNTGTMTNLKVEDSSGTLTVINGTEPSLNVNNINIIVDKGAII